MRIDRIAATAVLAAAATAAAAGVAHAAPAPAAAVSVQGSEQGIAFTTAPAADGRLVTTVASGAFAVTGGAVTLSDAAGTVVAALPLTVQTAGGALDLRPVVADAGRTLTLTPVSQTGEVQPVQDETTARKQYNAGVGAIIGAGIGAVIGFFLGGVGALVTVPIGAGIGALIGFSTP
ncbi:hypothetical protein [Nocardia harenae]|uniref:hypothetical protein n=1 Tax=Nocardia harenae TaxID=358707 RepID=UPI00082AAB5B|nr:hypothetical protein [Nocardia harenae]